MITVYGTTHCVWCDRAKDLLDAEGIEYKYVDVGEDADAQALFAEKGLRSVPQVFDGDTHIGGHDALKAHLQK